jgi:hypothetical protein
LLVDSISIIVDKKILFGSCLGDSLEYLGEKIFKIDFDQFDRCIVKQSIFLNVKLNCFKGSQLALNNFSYSYIPETIHEGVPRWYLFWKKWKKK